MVVRFFLELPKMNILSVSIVTKEFEVGAGRLATTNTIRF
jgi:hypothetical protein